MQTGAFRKKEAFVRYLSMSSFQLAASGQEAILLATDWTASAIFTMTSRFLTATNRHPWKFPPLGAQVPTSIAFLIRSSGTAWFFHLRIVRLPLTNPSRSCNSILLSLPVQVVGPV